MLNMILSNKLLFPFLFKHVKIFFFCTLPISINYEIRFEKIILLTNFQCSAKCGSGIQSRKVFCGSLTDDGVEKTEDSNCDAAYKYENTKNCTGSGECKGSWFGGPWSAVGFEVIFYIKILSYDKIHACFCL